MSVPFPVLEAPGMRAVDSRVDTAFKNALRNLAPRPTVYRKMCEAIANGPSAGGRAHAERYFGDELPGIVQRVTPLLNELENFFDAHRLYGFSDWLRITGYGDDYRMVQAFVAWSELKING